MINKKIASELAVGVILLLALVVGGIFWMQEKDRIQQVEDIDRKSNLNNQSLINKPSNVDNQQKDTDTSIYKNDEFGFEFEYPSDKLIVNGEPEMRIENQIQYNVNPKKDKCHSSLDLSALRFFVNADKKIVDNKSGEIISSSDGTRWLCSNGVTFDGKGDNLFEDCWSIGNTYAFGFTAYFDKDATCFTKSDFESIVKSFRQI